MERQIAEELIAEVRTIVDSLNRMSSTTMKISEANERSSLRETLARFMVNLDAQLVRPITRVHPDLDPVE
jgi:hypothetical protein